uniref:Uncharacterized protein n=2 Tax=Eukaryota TaxID=2759 RepID=A0A7S3CSE0_9SPIT|mmetsp:Transcript_33610/g.60113  ORF Transcript_33610/g.60113 Transcript_33610/m.60113 type:complete len:117 (+) Transcript_33610:221-571(+)
MADFNPAPYRGDPKIPHVTEDFFKIYFTGANLALGMLTLPGRFFGTEIRPRKFSSDFVVACVEENAQKREMRAGKPIRQSTIAPTFTTHSYNRMWHRQLNRKRWVLERQGPIYAST